MNKWTIVLLDDEENYLLALEKVMKNSDLSNVEIRSFLDHSEAELFIQKNRNSISVIVLDYRLNGLTGLDFIKKIQDNHANFQILILSGQVDYSLTSAFPRLNIFDLLEKNLKLKEIRDHIIRAHDFSIHLFSKELRLKEMSRKVDDRVEVGDFESFHGIIYESKAMKELVSTIKKIANSDVTCMVIGESGTGKEMIARSIHEESNRKTETYSVINCAAIPDDLIESELFGYRKGAFTGALQDKKGILELSTNGTIFLDEVTEISYNLQAKLLRFLQENTIQVLGDKGEKKINVRVVAASNRNLKEAIEARVFREDLYYRLSVVELEIPPLRERKEDISVLFNYFIRSLSSKENKPDIEIPEEIYPIIEKYPWPGNVRELRNIAYRAVLFSENGSFSINSLPKEILNYKPKETLSLKTENSLTFETQIPEKTKNEILSKKDLEKENIINALKKTGGDREKAAELIGISRASIYRKIKEYNLDI